MKRILLCERSLVGHRKTYLKWLASISDTEMFVYAPKNIGIDSNRFIPMAENLVGRGVVQYWCWIKSIRRIVQENRIDAVHILDGDSIMRFFGLGFGRIGAKHIIITYHHFFEGLSRKLSYHMMNRVKGSVSVVHTENVREKLTKIGVKHVAVCQYPAFEFESIADRDPVACKERYQLHQDIPVIGIIGGMCRYKNIIPFLTAMKKCNSPFHLLICGSASDISEEEILEAVEPYSEKVTAMIRHLSEEEYKDAIVASDIIYCIYGHEFNGASGPLTDGVCAEKMILSCAHGSLGEIVSNNHLGFIAECTDKEQIIGQTNLALQKAKDFLYDEHAQCYRENISVKSFLTTYQKIYSK